MISRSCGRKCCKSCAKSNGELLNTIIIDNDVINEYFINGHLLSLLNSSTLFNVKDVYSLIFSLNQYTKINKHNPKAVKEVFILILNSTFICDSVEPIVKEYFFNIPMNNDIEVMLTFFINCLELLPNYSLKKMGILYPCVLYISEQCFNDTVKLKCKCLKTSIENTKRTIENNNIHLATLSQVNNRTKKELKQLSIEPVVKLPEPTVCIRPAKSAFILPHYSDILSSNRSSSRDINRKYESVEDYLEIQFQSYKNNLLKPLKDAISEIKDKQFVKSSLKLEKYQVTLYEGVLVEDIYPSEKGLVYRVSFDITKFDKNFNWEKSERFTNGSMVCFTNNFFDTVYFASFVDNDHNNLSKGILLIKFMEDPIHDVLVNNTFLMLETQIHSDTFKYVLTKFRNFTSETLPFKNRIVLGDNIIKSPAFLNENDMEKIVSSFKDEIDDSEKEAIVDGLMSDLSLIKGRPGSGKTYICSKMIKFIVDSYNYKEFGPILVICHTEDDLNQFVFEIIKTIGIDNVVRVGDHSKMNMLEKCNISIVKWEWVKKKVFPNYLFVRCGKNRREMENSEECLIRRYINVINSKKRLLSIDDLSVYMKSSHRNYFQRNDFDDWIQDRKTMLKIFKDVKYSVSTQLIPTNEYDTLLNEVLEYLVFDVVVKVIKDESMSNCSDDSTKKNETLKTVDSFRLVANGKLIANIIPSISLTDTDYDTIESLDVDFGTRIRLYRYWWRKHFDNLMTEYSLEKEKYDNLVEEMEQLISNEYFHIMKTAKVIAMTTTLAAKYGSVLDQLNCKIVVIKESGKIPECEVICSLTKDTEQLIMLGYDISSQKQINTFQSDSEFKPDLSLFKRLTKSNFHYFTLKHQYEKIEIGQCGAKLDCGHLCTWLNHIKSPSHKDYKCKMNCRKICARNLHYCKLLCSQECQCIEETLLMLPCGHEKTLKCNTNVEFEDCISNCQKILDCGHKCMAICGEKCFCRTKVIRKLICGHKVNVYCTDKFTHRDCQEICGKVLNCGHKCKNICSKSCLCKKKVNKSLPCGHEVNIYCWDSILNYRCEELCKRVMSCGHICKKRCIESCVCVELVERTLPCLHNTFVKCGLDASSELCAVTLTKQFPCGHYVNYHCFENLRRCNYKSYEKLPCGHFKQIKCGEDKEFIVCREKCGKTLMCKHICESLCHSPKLCPECTKPHDNCILI